MAEHGKIIVSRPEDPAPSGPPGGRVLAGLGLAAIAVLAVFGLVGDPAGSDDLHDQPLEAEAVSIASTAATTLATTTAATTTDPGDGDVEILSAAELAAAPRLSFEELAVPPGMPIVSHLVMSGDGLHAFGPLTPPGTTPYGLAVSRHDGDRWSDPMEVVPPDHAVLEVAGGDLGVVVVSTPGPVGVFGIGTGAGSVIWASTDGVEWRREPLVVEGRDGFVGSVAVGTDGAWIFGTAESELAAAVDDALPPDYARLVADGSLVPDVGRFEVALFTARLPTQVASFPVDELGLGELGLETDRIALFSPDLVDWRPVEVPFDVASARLITDDLGIPTAMTRFRVWANVAGQTWLQRTEIPDGQDLAGATFAGGELIAVGFGTTGRDVRTITEDATTRVRFAIAGQTVGGIGLGADTAVSPAGVAFPTFPRIELIGEPPRIEIAEGWAVVVDLDRAEYRVLAEDGSVAASVLMFGPSRSFVLDPVARTVDLLDSAGGIAATVALEQLDRAAGSALQIGANRSGGLVYQLEGGWRYQSLDELLAGGADAMVPSAIAMSRSALVIAAKGVSLPGFADEVASRIWVASR